jgi:hypothetical protein
MVDTPSPKYRDYAFVVIAAVQGLLCNPIMASLRRSASIRTAVPNAGALTCLVYAIESSRAPLKSNLACISTGEGV